MRALTQLRTVPPWDWQLSSSPTTSGLWQSLHPTHKSVVQANTPNLDLRLSLQNMQKGSGHEWRG